MIGVSVKQLFETYVYAQTLSSTANDPFIADERADLYFL
ncbi:MAG: hypothetical protein JWQ69_310 [Pseudomonas sp.]|nr:hypothetical protein [Pseudomonas sp.]